MCQTVKGLQICLRCYMSVFRTRTSPQQESVSRMGEGNAKQETVACLGASGPLRNIRAHLHSTEGHPPSSAL